MQAFGILISRDHSVRATAVPVHAPAYAGPQFRPYGLPLLLAALGVVAVLRLITLALNGTDLFTDEAQYWSWSRELDFGYYSKPPLIAWIISASTATCGDSEFCVRLPAVMFNLATCIVIYGLGRRLFSEKAGFWSSLSFATLPGISLSSGIISTDVPLLLAWAIALLAFAELAVVPSVTMAVVLGLAVGFGLNAKYAMAYFVACAALYFFFAPERRALLRTPYLWISAAIAAALIVPNLVWNASNGFITFSHTADNANWTGSLFHPGRALEFAVSQFAVFGPILFGALLVIAWRVAGARGPAGTPRITDPERLLLCFSLPIILAVTVQAFLSRSLANWAAPAYIAATLLVIHTMLWVAERRPGERKWLKASLAVNSAIAIAIAVATSFAGQFVLPGGSDPFARTMGNRELANDIRAGIEGTEARQGPYGALLTDDRDIAAALAYYGRDFKLPTYAWRNSETPRNHFEMTKPFKGGGGSAPVLLVSRRPDGSGIPAKFRSVLTLGPISTPAGEFSERIVYLFELTGFVGEQ